ncbi:hypothetical protein CSIM01_13320 [Colletotrichum simmondsii]|uniref:Uncharacterized protein n=1 Tax=Colletotrichum simmondsii TaxID=703756 RepID=A0A135TYH2_9PEZI|nr:hypothetical protein CSIM01_13320 [Colletotrichum simmondsii]
MRAYSIRLTPETGYGFIESVPNTVAKQTPTQPNATAISNKTDDPTTTTSLTIAKTSPRPRRAERVRSRKHGNVNQPSTGPATPSRDSPLTPAPRRSPNDTHIHLSPTRPGTGLHTPTHTTSTPSKKEREITPQAA